MVFPDDIKIEDGEKKEGILYTKGVASEDFYLILQGKVIVESGSEGFLV